MFDTLRILVSRRCNFQCSYCCNEIKEVKETINLTTMHELRNFLTLNESVIKNVCITGGEPFMDVNWKTTVNLCLLLSKYKDINVYAYTNGCSKYMIRKVTTLTGLLGEQLKGLNVSYHDEYEKSYDKLQFSLINKLVPVRLMVEKKMMMHKMIDIVSFLLSHDMIDSYKTFTLGDCKRNNEIIFELTDEIE